MTGILHSCVLAAVLLVSASATWGASPTPPYAQRLTSSGGPLPTDRLLTPGPLWVRASADMWSPENQTPDTVGFTAVISGGTAPFQESWNFGDGSSNASGLAPSHTFEENGSFLVVLTISDATSHHATSTVVVDTTYFSVPFGVTAAAIPFVVPAGAASPAVSFAVTNYPGNPVAYAWDFGDGQNSTNATPTHTYSAPGEYLVQLAYEYSANFAGTPRGSFWNVSYELTVLVLPGATVPPVATILAAYNGGGSFSECAPFSWVADLLPVVAGGLPPYTENWSFGDGSSGSSSGGINHTYGTYVDEVHLTVTDANGSTATASAIVGGFPVPAYVTTCPPSPSSLLIAYLTFGGILAGSAVIVAVFWLPRRRTRRRP